MSDAMTYRQEVERSAAGTRFTNELFVQLRMGAITLDELEAAVCKRDRLMLACLGLAGEVGEFVDMVKKEIFHGKPMDRDRSLKELGDIRWYLEYGTIAMDTTMKDVELMNTAKLRARYPDGFTTAAAIAKADEA